MDKWILIALSLRSEKVPLKDGLFKEKKKIVIEDVKFFDNRDGPRKYVEKFIKDVVTPIVDIVKLNINVESEQSYIVVRMEIEKLFDYKEYIEFHMKKLE